MRRIVLSVIVLAACTSSEPPESPPASASAPAPIAVTPAPIEAPRGDAPEASPSETARDAIDAPRPTTTGDPKCAEATKRWAAGADAMAAERREQARQEWLVVIRDFPTCPEVPHVFLGFGDDAFARGDMTAAKQFYEKTAQFPEPELRAYAIYKQAWCELNLGQHDKALQSFVSVARSVQADVPPPRLARLRDVALRDSTVAFAEVGQPAKARDFYRHVAGASADDLLRRLATHYEDRGDAAAAAAVRP
ncbi:MAG TPA: tetratricopeptide repeat protein [Nannocystaceae bacterium]|nr:tetratricopeptide repeat protein [Nannocystaceae bacterium]